VRILSGIFFSGGLNVGGNCHVSAEKEATSQQKYKVITSFFRDLQICFDHQQGKILVLKQIFLSTPPTRNPGYAPGNRISSDDELTKVGEARCLIRTISVRMKTL